MRKVLAISLFLVISFVVEMRGQIITTIAGTGTSGYSGDGGPGIFAQICGTNGITCDPIGNIYFTDRVNKRVRKIDTAGIITTIAGTGTAGFSGDGGPATAALLSSTLEGLALDYAGNLYFDDQNNSRIRKITPAGIISTVAGNGISTSSGDGGPATAASINIYTGDLIDVDSSGNIYLFDGNVIRKVNTSGIIYRVAGTGIGGYSGDGGPATAANIAGRISVDKWGNIYMVGLGRVRKVDMAGIITTIAGNGTYGSSGDGGPATSALIDQSNFLMVDRYGNIYIEDDYRIRKIDTAGIINTIAGIGISGHSGDGGPATAAKMTPTNVCADIAGNLYLSDGYRIRKIGHNRMPTFTLGLMARDTVCGNETDSLNSLLTVIDNDVSQPLIWSIVSAPMHGTAVATDTVTSIGVTTPQGLYYMPSGSYAGNDTLTVQVFDGFLYDTITLYMHVLPIPAAITGITTVCPGNTITVATTTSGGAWSASNTNATIGSVSGVVTGITAGIDTIAYTLPSGCAVNKIITVNPLPATPGFAGSSSICVGGTTSLVSGPTGGAWSSGATSIATVGSSSGGITGVATGVAHITYTLAPGCQSWVPVTVLATPAAITGAAGVCVSGSSTLSNTTSGGTWTSGATSIATVSGSTGLTMTVNGVYPGTAIIAYTIANGCYATKIVTVHPLPPAIYGYGSICAATTTTLFNISPGGTWSSADPLTAIVSGSASGIITGVATGTATISYTLPTGCAATTVVTVEPSPAAITGSNVVCIGVPDTFSNTVTGGTWASSDYGVAFVDAGTGVVTGLGAGVATISYTHSTTGCYRTKSVTVSPAPTAIGGIAAVCQGNSATLTNAVPGGTWTSGATGIATINPISGMYTGVAAGVATMSYSIGTGCVVTRNVTVNPLPGAITGTTIVCAGATTTLGTTSTGGSWSSSNAGVANIGASTGIVTGGPVSSGTIVTITYTLPTTCKATTAFAVNPVPGPITGAGALCSGSSAGYSVTGGMSGSAWTSSAPGIAAIAGSTGLSTTLTGVSAGIATISYTLPSTCYSTKTVTVNAGTTGIVGASAVCIGGVTTLATGTPGGTWSKSNANVNIGASTGVVTGIATGTTTITYTMPTGCYATKTITVGTSGGSITGDGSVCVGGSAMLAMTSGSTGTWSSSSPTVAAVSGLAGLTMTVSGISAGVATISFTPVSGCIATKTFTVDGLPVAHNVTGGGSYCAGGAGLHVGLDGSAAGLIYQLYRGATVITGVTGTGGALDFGLHTTPGTYTVTATNTITGCVNNMSGSAAISINPLPAPISGATTVCSGSSTTLATGPAGGTWTSGNTGVATIGSSTGVVNGLTIGNTTITYTLPTGCLVTTTVNVSTAPTAITGAGTVCSGSTALTMTTTLASTPTGGLWSSSNAARATVNSTSGEVTGVGAGTVTITYSLGTGCIITKAMTVMPSPAAITGTGVVCSGSSTTLSTATSGGMWSSSTTGIATVTSTGTVNGVTAGIAVISYAAGGCSTMTIVTVNPVPAAIGGPSAVCVGASVTETNTVAGGVWSTTSANINIGSSTGVVAGIGAGTAGVTYAIGSCSVTRTITVNAAPTISGAGGVCVGATNALTVTPSGSGAWSSGSMTTATVSGAGVVTGVTPGIATITFTPTGGCAATKAITVNTAPTTITGTKSVCVDANTTLGNGAGGGVWSSGSALIATINSTSGEVTGWVPGTANITYSLGTGCAVTAVVTVNPLPSAITGTAVMCVGSTTALSSGTAGGVWSSGSMGIATISPTGTVSGIAIGTAPISYTNPSSGCSATRTVTVTAVPDAISGANAVCMGSTLTLTNTTPGGTWTSSNPIVAAIGTATGVVSGVNTGSAVITYSLGPGCTVTKIMTVNPIPAGISGAAAICKGSSTTLTTSAAGGTWVTSGGIATVGSSSGVVTGVSGGSAIISYTMPTGCASTYTLSVVAVPAISGIHSMCAWGDTMTVTNGMTTGSYSSALATVMNLGGGVGLVTAHSPGTATITYTIAGLGCSTTSTITVNPLPGAIGGPVDICVGGTGTMVNFTLGGTWSSSAPAVATIGTSSGIVSAISGGTSTIVYTLPTGCKADTVITVSTFPVAGTITGVGTVCSGATSALALTGGAGSGVWNSSDAAIASITSGGIVTGVTSGAATITYTVTNVCGTAMAKKTITVNATPSAGVITGADSVCVGGIVVLSNTVMGGVWSMAGVNAAVMSTGTLSGLIAGVDTVYYTVTENGCTARAVWPVRVMPITACGSLVVNEINDEEIRVYPNPNGGEFIVRGRMGNVNGEVAIEVSNMLGQILQNRVVRLTGDEINEQVQLPCAIPNGMYVVTLRYGSESKVVHFVVER